MFSIKKTLVACALVISLVAALVGCGAPAPTVEVVKIGINVPVSGTGAIWGWAVLHPAEIAVDRINAEGGLVLGGQTYIIQIVAYDHAFDPAKSVENIQRMILQDEVDYVVMSGGSASYPTFDIAVEAGLPMLHQGPSAWPVMEPEYEYIWFCQVGNLERGFGLYKYLVEEYEVENVIIVNPDDESGWNSTADSEVAAAQFGVEVLATEYYQRGVTDFYPLLSRLLPLEPDCFELGMSPLADEANFVKQARELGFEGKISTMTSINIEVMSEIAGLEYSEGFIGSTGSWGTYDPFLTEEEEQLRDECLIRYGPPFPTGMFAFGYATELLIEAFKKADSIDKEKVREVLENEVLTVRGRELRFGGLSIYPYKRIVIAPLPITEIVGGEVVTVEIIELPPDY